MRVPPTKPLSEFPFPAAQPGLLITGVNPFEDLPGYQFYSMLQGDDRFRLEIADDSEAALAVLRTTGAEVHQLEHPGRDEAGFLTKVTRLCEQRDLRLIIPGADAHLFALARSEALASLCPAAQWFADRQIRNKWDLQEWIATYLPVPQRWPLPAVDDRTWSRIPQKPVVVKGLRKGAASCESADELSAAVRAILKNPANQGPHGGLYLEEHVEGEELCVVMVRFSKGRPLTLGLRKLATTEAGTTLAAKIEADVLDELQMARIAEQLDPGMALELEMRRDQDRVAVFEVNLRLPSWMGALGDFGRDVLSATVETQLGREIGWSQPSPQDGTLIYRLPQSGFLAPENAFAGKGRRSGGELLWPWATPHQFRVK